MEKEIGESMDDRWMSDWMNRWTGVCGRWTEKSIGRGVNKWLCERINE